MTVQMIPDKGQKLAPPLGKVLGVVDTQKQLNEVTTALQAAGFAKVTAIKGEDGVNLLERLEGFFFSDAEERVLARHIDELKAGHFIFAVAVPGDRVNEMAEIASRHGARFLVHFGFAVVTWLKK